MAQRNWSKQTLLKRLVQTMVEEHLLPDNAVIEGVVDGAFDDDLSVVTGIEIVAALKAAIIKESLR